MFYEFLCQGSGELCVVVLFGELGSHKKMSFDYLKKSVVLFWQSAKGNTPKEPRPRHSVYYISKCLCLAVVVAQKMTLTQAILQNSRNFYTSYFLHNELVLFKVLRGNIIPCLLSKYALKISVRSRFQRQRLPRPSASLSAGNTDLLCSQLPENFCQIVHTWHPTIPEFSLLSRLHPMHNVG